MAEKWKRQDATFPQGTRVRANFGRYIFIDVVAPKGRVIAIRKRKDAPAEDYRVKWDGNVFSRKQWFAQPAIRDEDHGA